MEQTQRRISDERLAEIVACDGWSGSPNDITLTARELTALRASHKRLMEALEDAQKVYVLMADKWGMEGNRMMEGAYSAKLAVVKAALADARKLEGE